MKSVSVSDARRDMSDLVNRVAYGKERIYFTSHDKKIVALVPIEDVKTLELLESALENADDIHEAELALKEVEKKGSIPIAEIRKRLRN